MSKIPTKDPKFFLRIASPEDAGLVVSFMKKLGDFQNMSDEIIATSERIEKLLAAKQGEAVFGVYDGKTVGFCLFSSEKFGLYGALRALYRKRRGMEYILFIHNNSNATATSEQWQEFFVAANKSGIFLGGSEISNQIQLGTKSVEKITDKIAGFMRFEADDIKVLLELLTKHPVILQGGTLELCEMPKS